jgi:general secretion pathway protein G
MFARILTAVHAGAGTGRAAARWPAKPGLTFIEILVVMIILALIAGIVGTQLIGQAEKAKADATRIQIRSLTSALDLYRLHNSTYPTTEQGLSALVRRPEVGVIPENWQGPYLTSKNVPQDGWGRNFLYSSNGGSYAIRSLGADGAEAGSDLDADISSDDL